MSTGPDQWQANSFLSVSRKRQTLWNVVEPGDPYDIRKSMIARVPGDKKGFMGDHLQIVCLFQAAQIQRLCQFLDDFKLRYRQIERRQLDRHSYEVQIKQLTHKLAEQAGFRQQNQKLRQFIKNQSNTKQGMEDSIKSRYEKLLLQIQGSQNENQRLKRQNEQISFQMASFDAKFQALHKSKQTQIDEMYMKLSQQSSMSSQLQLNSLKSQYQSQIQRLDLQSKRLKQTNEDRQRQIESWQQRYVNIEQQLLRNSPRNDVIKYERQMAEYQNRFVIFGQEIDRLNLIIKEITNKFQISEQRKKQYESRFDNLNKQSILLQSKLAGSISNGSQSQELVQRNSELEYQNKRLQESGKYLKDFENKLKQANDQIIRLGNQLRLQTQNVNRYRTDIQRNQYEQSRVNILEKQKFQYKQAVAQNNSLRIKIAQDQNKIALLRQQIQRLREDVNRKAGQDGNYRTLVYDYQNLQRQIGEWERKNQLTIQQYETKITQKVTQYESRIQSINRTQGNQFQSRAAILQSQMQRLNELLRRKNDEVQTYQRQVRELQYTITNKYQLDTSRKVQNYESVIQNLKKQNEEFIRRIRELEPLQRRINQYENRGTITAQQIQRLNQQIRARDNDMQNLRRQIRQQEIAIVQKYEMDTTRKLGNFQANLNNLNRENHDLKRKCAQIQNKAALLNQQIQRLTNNLRQAQLKSNHYEQQIQRLQRLTKQTQMNITSKYQFQVNQKVTNYENVIRNNQREKQENRRRIIELQNGNMKIVQYENKLNQMVQQLDRVNIALRQKQQQSHHLQNSNRNLIRQFEDLGRKYTELQNAVRNKFEVETTRTITTLQQSIAIFKRQNDELKRYVQEYEGKLKGQNKNLEGLSLNLVNLSQQNETLIRQLREMENSHRNKLEVQVTTKFNSYETNITELTRELDNFFRQNNQLKRVVQSAQQTNVKLKQENQDLRKRFQQDFGQVSMRVNEYQLGINQLKSEKEGLKRKVHELQTAIREKYEIQTGRRISSLQQNLSIANRQNQQLRRRIQQASREFQQLRRTAQNMERNNQELARRLRDFGDIHMKVVQYENKISLLAQELQRKNLSLRGKDEQLGQAEVHIRQLTHKLQNTQRNINQSQSSIQQFEVQLKTRTTQYEHNIHLLTQQINELKRRLNISGDVNRKITEYQNKIVILNQELERLNLNLRNQIEKYTQIQSSLRNSAAQNEDLKRIIADIQNNIAQKYQVQAIRAIRTLQQNIETLQKQNNQLKSILHELQQNNNVLSLDLQKLNVNLRGLSQQNNSLRNQIRQAQVSINRKYESQVTLKYTAYERDLTILKRQNQDMNRKLRQYAERMIPQHQNQIVILKQEIERLNHHLMQESGHLTSNLKALGQQNDGLKRQIVQLQQSITQKFQIQVNKKYSLYEQSINGLQKQNEELKRYIKQLGGKYESQLRGIGQNFTSLQRENQELKRSIQEMSVRYEAEIKKTVNFQQNLSGIGRENQQLKRRFAELQQEMQRLVRKLNQFQQQNQAIKRQAKQGQFQMVQRLQSEANQQINIYKQQIAQVETRWNTLQRENEQLQRRLNDLVGDAQNKITQYEEQARRLTSQIQRLKLGIREYDLKLRELTAQNDGLKRQVKETQLSITQRWESEFINKVTVYEHTIQNLNRQIQERQRGIQTVTRSMQDKEKNSYQANNKRIMELQAKAALFSQQLQRLNILLKSRNEENDKMRQQIERLNNTLRLKLEQNKQLETQLAKFLSVTQPQFQHLQSSYTIIARQNYNYKKHLSDYQNSIKKLYGQFERLQNIINDLKKQRQALFEKNYVLSNQIQRLLNQNKDLQVQVEDVRLRLSDQAALHKRINEHMALMVVLFAQIESLRKRVKDKQKQVQEVRRSSLAPFKLQSRARKESA